jgi:hypothetical protein
VRGAFAALAALTLAAPAAAMPVSTFLAKFHSLEAKGALATVTSDATLLKTELQDDAAALRAERLAAVQAGTTPAYCPDAAAGPPSFDEIIGALNEVPPADQGKTEVKDALRAYMARRFPCTQ